ncbi:MazG-like family protein [Sphaerisporangium aureirubrum]|uniref:MazG-like family protein n=1 Tax=Sphaerisporangium aureirubrum TaxID=1544736 RepID=A0ABW1NEX6_9ACTN
MTLDIWQPIEDLVTWLDTHTTQPADVELLLRLMKVVGEAGEVADAIDGVYGHNPRKGITHTWEDVDSELCDVILTAMAALRSRTPDAAQTFKNHLSRVTARSIATSVET